MSSDRFLGLLLVAMARRGGPAVLEDLRADVQRWRPRGTDFAENLGATFRGFREFRTLVFYRTKPRGLARILWLVYPPQRLLFLRAPVIGPGLYIQHGWATGVGARSIGKNCWINQQVIVGYSDETSCPTIGDDVTIGAGAIVIGDITIGDRAVIGAGAVVVKSVPSDCSVVGNPAYIVRRNGVRVNEAL
jgi:serine O-acetyltransferase